MSNITGGSITWNLDVNDSKLKSGLDGARSNVESAAKDIDKNSTNASNGVNKLSTAFKNAEGASKAFVATMATVGAGIVAAAGFAIKSASEMENLRMSLDVMTGSAESGGKVFKDLYDFAAKTPFETSNLAKATQTMLGFGIPAKSVMDNLKMLGDVSMGNNDKLQSLTLAFSQMSSTGRLMGQDLLQMINAGFNPLTIISQKTGKSMVELKDDMAAGSISAEMVTDAFKTATSQGGLFYQGMEKGSQTLSGTWSTLKDNIGMLARKLVGLSESGEVIKGGLFEKLKDGVKGVTDVISKLSTADGMKKIEDFLSNLKDIAPIVAGAILGGVVPAFVAWVASMAPILPFLAIGAAIGLLVQTLVKNFGGWGEVMKSLQPIFKTISDTFQNVILPVIKDIFNQITTQLIPALGKLFSELLPIAIPILKILAEILAVGLVVGIKLFIGVLTFAINLLTGVISVIKGIFTGIVDIVKGTIDFFTSLPETIANIWNLIVTGTVAFFDGIVSLFTYWIPYAIGFMIGWFISLPDKIKEIFTNVVNNIKTWGTNTWNYFSTEIPKWITNIVNWFKSLPQKIKDGLSSLGSTIKNTFVGAWNNLKDEISQWPSRIWDWGKNIANSFVDGFKNALKSIGSAFTKGISDAKSDMEGHSPPKTGPLKDIDKWGTNIGTAWVNGFANSIGGISTMFNSSMAQLQNILSSPSFDVANDTAGSGNTQNITIQSVNVKDKGDIDALMRAIGFKLTTV